MRNRVVEIGESPARLRVERRQLVIARTVAGVDVEDRLPLENLAVLILAHPHVSLTLPVLTELTDAGGMVVLSDASRMPCGLLLPTAAHGTQTQRMRAQLELSQPRCKQIWRQLVRGKIASQAALLRDRTDGDAGLGELIGKVRSGDPANVEAWAAKRYWSALFGSDFRRDRDAGGCNAMLNYGYAVLRATVARAVCAAGLHPSLGVHHHHRGNAFCLADDVIEPFRPVVDAAVLDLQDRVGTETELSGEVRGELLAALLGEMDIGGETRTLFDAVSRTASSLAAVIDGGPVEIALPTSVARPKTPSGAARSRRNTSDAETSRAAG